MRGKPALVFALVGVLAASAAGCGGGGGGFHSALIATLTPAAEMDAPGAPRGAGTARLTLNATTGRVCWTIAVRGLPDKPLSAHVQKGKAGKTGADALPLGGAFARKGCLTAQPKSVSAIGKDPGAYYVNVYTLKYIHGAIRGQLATSHAHAT